MDKRTLTQMWKENKFIVLTIIGVLVLSLSSIFANELLRKAHQSEFELCKEEAQSICNEIMPIIYETKQSEDFLVSMEMPTITVKTTDGKGIAFAYFHKGKAVIHQNLNALEEFLVILVGIICVAIYIAAIIYIWKRRKKRNVS